MTPRKCSTYTIVPNWSTAKVYKFYERAKESYHFCIHNSQYIVVLFPKLVLSHSFVLSLVMKDERAQIVTTNIFLFKHLFQFFAGQRVIMKDKETKWIANQKWYVFRWIHFEWKRLWHVRDILFTDIWVGLFFSFPLLNSY